MKQTASNPKPLAGLRVINLGWFWVCATITHLLGDMGAEVIKIDSRQRLEPLKAIPPFMGGIADPDHALWPHNLSRNNQGISINLDTQHGRDLLKELVSETDVVAENWTPGTMKKLGLGYEELRKVRPDLIMISPSAAGQWGPLYRINTLGSVLSCLAGLDTFQGYEGERPIPFGTAITDPAAGLVGLFAVLAALRHRNATGQGRHIDFSQWEAMSTMLAGPMLDYQMNGRLPATVGNRDPIHVPHNVYRCQGEDNWVAIAVYSQGEWEGLRRAMGEPPWAREPRFGDKFRRKRREAELDELVSDWTLRHTHYEAAEILQNEGVPAFPALSARDLYTDPHFEARASWLRVEHPLGSEVIYGGHWKFSDTPVSVRLPGPMVAQHNEAVFGDLLGYSESDLAKLTEEKVLF